MKSTGIVRRVDELGRVVIPIELRRMLNIEEGDPVEIFVDGEMVILKKYQPGCVFCNDMNELEDYKGKKVCGKCLNKLGVLAE